MKPSTLMGELDVRGYFNWDSPCQPKGMRPGLGVKNVDAKKHLQKVLEVNSLLNWEVVHFGISNTQEAKNNSFSRLHTGLPPPKLRAFLLAGKCTHHTCCDHVLFNGSITACFWLSFSKHFHQLGLICSRKAPWPAMSAGHIWLFEVLFGSQTCCEKPENVFVISEILSQRQLTTETPCSNINAFAAYC